MTTRRLVADAASITATPHQRVAVVGPRGRGKTTLVKALERCARVGVLHIQTAALWPYADAAMGVLHGACTYTHLKSVPPVVGGLIVVDGAEYDMWRMGADGGNRAACIEAVAGYRGPAALVMTAQTAADVPRAVRESLTTLVLATAVLADRGEVAKLVQWWPRLMPLLAAAARDAHGEHEFCVLDVRDGVETEYMYVRA